MDNEFILLNIETLEILKNNKLFSEIIQLYALKVKIGSKKEIVDKLNIYIKPSVNIEEYPEFTNRTGINKNLIDVIGIDRDNIEINIINFLKKKTRIYTSKKNIIILKEYLYNFINSDNIFFNIKPIDELYKNYKINKNDFINKNIKNDNIMIQTFNIFDGIQK